MKKGVTAMDNKRQKPIVSFDELMSKSHRYVSSQEALKDVTPPQWSDDVMNGKRKIAVDKKRGEMK